MPSFPDARRQFREFFGAGPVHMLSVPGRVNLIGEHIDYHALPVLPVAIRRRIRLSFRPRGDALIRAVSTDGFGRREFAWKADLTPAGPGDWENYLRAAAQLVGSHWAVGRGIDAVVASDLPPAAGLSSSTALMVAMTLALLQANHLSPGFEELMSVLPDGEQFVGTRGGGMDHAAVLGSRTGCASLVGFDPVSLRAVPLPGNWAFLVGHSMVTAEKSGSVRQFFNARRTAGTQALARLGLESYPAALARNTPAQLAGLAGSLPPDERNAFVHVIGEAQRVRAATEAMERSDAAAFGELLLQSHASLRDLLQVSCPALDSLVQCAVESKALGARLTGAGFGGCAVIFCERRHRPRLRRLLIRNFYSRFPEFREDRHLIDADPWHGVLYRT